MYLEPYLDAIEKINNFMNSENIPTVECFNKKETDELLENILTKIDDYINENILMMKEPDFHTTLKGAVFEIIELFIQRFEPTEKSFVLRILPKLLTILQSMNFHVPP